MEQRTLERRVEELERTVNELKAQVIDNSGARSLVDKLNMIVNGDDEMGVTPLRQDVRSIAQSVEELQSYVQRAKWVALALAAGNGTQLVTWIASIFGG